MPLPTQPFDPSIRPASRKNWLEQVKEGLASVAATCLAMMKFGGLALLKTSGSMLLYIVLYAQIFGWGYGVGVVLSIFIHELGHYFAFRYFGVEVTAMNFIPFVGAYVAYRGMPRNSWIEASTALAGPVAGSLAGALAYLLFSITQNSVYLSIAYFGFLVNLLNMIPFGMLDGNKIAEAIPPVAWVLALPVLIAVEFIPDHFNLVLLGVIILGAVFAFQQFRGRQTRYLEATPEQRFWISFSFFTLVLATAWYSNTTFSTLREIIPSLMGD